MRGKGEGSVFKDSRGYWTGTVELPSHDGTRRRKVVRAKTKVEAVRKLRALQSELGIRGDLPTGSPTVEGWANRWLIDIEKTRRPNTAGNYRTVTRKYIIPTIGNRRLEKVTQADVRAVTSRVENEFSSTYALNVHRVLSVMLEAALREGLIGRNPAKLTPAPRKRHLDQDALTLEEAVHVLEFVSARPDGARWATALLTGARRGEVLGMEADRVGDSIDLSWQLQRLAITDRDGRPDVPADYEYRHVQGGLYLTRPKSASGWRIVPMFEPLRTILERHIATYPTADGLIFTRGNEGSNPARWGTEPRPRDPAWDTKQWREVLTASGITKDVPLHGLRHTAVDLLYLAGVPEDIILRIVGHSMVITTRGYKSGDMTRITAAMDQFGAMFSVESQRRRELPGQDTMGSAISAGPDALDAKPAVVADNLDGDI